MTYREAICYIEISKGLYGANYAYYCVICSIPYNFISNNAQSTEHELVLTFSECSLASSGPKQ
jgi:hypothetical protein